MRNGEAFLAARQTDAALEAFERACASDPGNIDVRARLAKLLHRLGRDAEAIAQLRAAARLSDDPARWMRRIDRIAGWGLDARRP